MSPTIQHCSPAESLSALVDGQTVSLVIVHHLEPANLFESWNTYHTIGNVLRSPDVAVSGLAYGADPEFLQRLSVRLQDEKIHQPGLPVHNPTVVKPAPLAANDATFRWKLVAGLSSFGAVAAVAWIFAGSAMLTPDPQLAQGLSGAATTAGTQRVVVSPEGLMVRDARLEELLSAHKQLGGTSLQAPSGFLRNAGFESAQGGQR